MNANLKKFCESLSKKKGCFFGIAPANNGRDTEIGSDLKRDAEFFLLANVFLRCEMSQTLDSTPTRR
ncbi:hypothetical protein [Polaromonas sp.]|uniref:hypothetical protein n=1 Tax=Polaromonas sp. TaxID=1869339 RepID=UPI00286B6B92|nr:hypothetical protein [Polaromonas sp.]